MDLESEHARHVRLDALCRFELGEGEEEKVREGRAEIRAVDLLVARAAGVVDVLALGARAQRNEGK